MNCLVLLIFPVEFIAKIDISLNTLNSFKLIYLTIVLSFSSSSLI